MDFRTHKDGRKYPIKGKNIRKINEYELKMIPHWLFEMTQKNQAHDPRGMGRETADSIVARSRTRKQIKDAQERARLETKQDYLSKQTKEYYRELDEELSSYLKKNDNVLDMYRRIS